MSKTSNNNRGRIAVILGIGIFLAVAVVSAAVIIVRGVRRIEPVETQLQLGSQAPDIGLRRFRQNLRRRLEGLESRYMRNYQEIEIPTPEQESLVSVITVELDSVRAELARLDTLAMEENHRELGRRRDPLFERYQEMEKTVARLGQTVQLSRALPDTDSLERELEQLLEID